MYQLAEGNIKNLNKHVFHSKRKKNMSLDKKGPSQS